MSGIVGSKFNIRGSGLVGSLGTDGQHMLSAGAGKTNVFETVAAAAGGAWTKIENQSITSNTATVDFTTLSSDYRDFRIFCSGVTPETNDSILRLLVSEATTFQTTYYSWINTQQKSDSGTNNVTYDGNDDHMPLEKIGAGTSSGENFSTEITIFDVHDTAFSKPIRFVSSQRAAALGVTSYCDGAGVRQGTAAIDGLRLLFSADDIALGEFTLYGRKIT